MIRRLFAVLAVLFPMTLSASEVSKGSTRIEVILGQNPYSSGVGRYPEWLQKLRSDWIGWKATGYETFADDKVSDLKSGAKLLSLEWDIRHHPAIQQLAIHFPDGTVSRALLAAQPTDEARPLLVFRSGIFSNVDEMYPERAFAILFFEQLGFHVLIIENMSSADYYENNNKISFGGFDEGLQNLWLAEHLKKSAGTLGVKISKTHLMGVSLGGAGVVWASKFDEKNLYSSYMGLCPVVDLKATMDRLTETSLTNFFIGSWAQRRLIGATQKVEALKGATALNIFSLLQKATGDSYRPPEKELWPLDYQKRFSDQKSGPEIFWKLNDILNIPSTNPHPITLWVNERDFIVPPSINAFLLKEKAKVWSHGVHCSFPTADNWSVMVEEFRKVFGISLTLKKDQVVLMEASAFHDVGSQKLVGKLNSLDLKKRIAKIDVTTWSRGFQRTLGVQEVQLQDLGWTDLEMDRLLSLIKKSSSKDPGKDLESLQLANVAVHDWIQRQISLKLRISKVDSGAESQCQTPGKTCVRFEFFKTNID